MKNSRIFDSKRLISDAYCYLFVEWLRRYKLYDKFVENHTRALNSKRPVNQLIREHVRCLIKCPWFSMSQAISSAFPFVSTPEGPDFWQRVSDDWIRFFNDFSRN